MGLGVEVKEQLQGSFLLSFQTGCFVVLELYQGGRLAGQEALGFPLPVLPILSTLDLPPVPFVHILGESNSGPHICEASTLPIKSFSQPRTVTFLVSGWGLVSLALTALAEGPDSVPRSYMVVQNCP